MTVILAFVLVLWAWGRFELFAICTGHGNGSKIDFIATENCGVGWCPGRSRNLKTLFQKDNCYRGLHNRYYQQQPQTLINKGFLD